jgi:hypothetical protein
MTFGRRRQRSIVPTSEEDLWTSYRIQRHTSFDISRMNESMPLCRRKYLNIVQIADTIAETLKAREGMNQVGNVYVIFVLKRMCLRCMERIY